MEYNSKQYSNSSKYPIRFDRLNPGSLYTIHAERSRDMKWSKDRRVYRKAQVHEGFYSTNTANGEAVILYPEDLVQPVREVK